MHSGRLVGVREHRMVRCSRYAEEARDEREQRYRCYTENRS